MIIFLISFVCSVFIQLHLKFTNISKFTLLNIFWRSVTFLLNSHRHICQLTFIFVSGHARVKGNERVDVLVSLVVAESWYYTHYKNARKIKAFFHRKILALNLELMNVMLFSTIQDDLSINIKVSSIIHCLIYWEAEQSTCGHVLCVKVIWTN